MGGSESPPFAPNFAHDRLSDQDRKAVHQVFDPAHHLLVPLVHPRVRKELFAPDRKLHVDVEAATAYAYPRHPSGFGYETRQLLAPPKNMDDHEFLALCQQMVRPLIVEEVRAIPRIQSDLERAGTYLAAGILQMSGVTDISPSFMAFFAPRIFAEEPYQSLHPNMKPDHSAFNLGATLFCLQAEKRLESG